MLNIDYKNGIIKMGKNKRQSGILNHITSLPNKLGLGTFSDECERFIDFMALGKFTCWQVLPFADCGYGLSPYAALSSFAINPYFLDITRYLTPEEIEGLNLNKFNPNRKEEEGKLDIAHGMIFDKFHTLFDSSDFEKKNKYWLDDYALYKVIKNNHNQVSWVDFPADLRDRKKEAILEFKKKHRKEIMQVKFIQYLLDIRWKDIRKYGRKKGVEIFGDIPFYVELDSADVWSNPKDWQLTGVKPKNVAGVPPDYFNEKGQLWGYPLYNYDNMAKNRYKFWADRFRRLDDLYDIIRIDHFIAFARYWSVPATSETAEKGKWVKGKGNEILKVITKAKGRLVAEDLGILDKSVYELKDKFGIPGLKVIMFAYDGEGDNMYQPHNYEKDSVAYISNHDTDTFMGMLSEGHWDKINRIKNYLRMPLHEGNEQVMDNMIVALYRSSANMVILTMQDILKLGKEGRMNCPGVVSDTNWSWQLSEIPSDYLMNFYRELSDLYAR